MIEEGDEGRNSRMNEKKILHNMSMYICVVMSQHSSVPSPSHCLQNAKCTHVHVGGRPGPFYCVNDVNAHLHTCICRQSEEGSPIKRVHFYAFPAFE